MTVEHHLRLKLPLLGVALALATLSASAVSADPSASLTACLRPLSQPPAVTVSACTAALSGHNSEDPERARMLEQRSLMESETGDNAQARDDADTAIRLWITLAKSSARGSMPPTVTKLDVAIGFFARGLARRRLGDHAGALSDFDQAIQLQPAYPIALMERALLWKTEGNRTAALTDLNEVSRLRPDWSRAYYLRGTLWLDQHDDGKAMADFNAAVRLTPKAAPPLMGRAEVWERKHDHDKALADYSSAIAAEPNYAMAYADRANVWWRKGDYPQALADYTTAVDLYAHGITNVRPGDADAALDAASGYAAAVSSRSAVRLLLGDLPGALADADASIRIDASDFHTWNAACWARVAANSDLDTALADCNRAIQTGTKDDNLWSAYDSRAGVSYRRADYAAAIQDETTALNLSPNQAPSLFLRSLAEAKAGKSAEAAADLKAALAADPNIAATYAKWGLK
jgi:tetratricopeptide (TPR) repeat protein